MPGKGRIEKECALANKIKVLEEGIGQATKECCQYDKFCQEFKNEYTKEKRREKPREIVGWSSLKKSHKDMPSRKRWEGEETGDEKQKQYANDGL